MLALTGMYQERKLAGTLSQPLSVTIVGAGAAAAAVEAAAAAAAAANAGKGKQSSIKQWFKGFGRSTTSNAAAATAAGADGADGASEPCAGSSSSSSCSSSSLELKGPWAKDGFNYSSLEPSLATAAYLSVGQARWELHELLLISQTADKVASLDHVIQVAKRMQGGYKGMLIVCGASGNVLGYWRVNTASLEEVLPELTEIAERERVRGKVCIACFLATRWCTTTRST
jgi:hypothetical protein